MMVQSAVEALSTTTRMAAAYVELSVDYAIDTVINILLCIFSLKVQQTTTIKAFVEKKHVISSGCRPIQWCPEDLWSVPVGETPLKLTMKRVVPD